MSILTFFWFEGQMFADIDFAASGCPQLKTTFKKEQFAFLNRSHYNIDAFDVAGLKSHNIL